MKIVPYNPPMPRRLSRPRPKQAARLVQLRKSAGLSQAALADLTGISQKTIAYWETSASAPRAEALPALSNALGVSVEDILGKSAAPQRRPGPVGRLQRVFEQARTLPRRQQDLVAQFVTTLIEQNQRKAS